MRSTQNEIDVVVRRGAVLAIGSMADDVVMATYSYPELTVREREAVQQFAELLDGFSQTLDDQLIAMSAPRQMGMASLSDSLESLQLHLVGPDSHDVAAKLRDAARSLLSGSATEEQVEDVRLSANSLARVTFDQQLDSPERQGMPWTRKTSVYS